MALESVTVAPPAGAGALNVIGKGTDWPVFTERAEGSVIEPNTDTVTFKLPPVMFGEVVLALIVEEPAAAAVTCKLTLVALASMLTVAGTFATEGLLDVRVIDRPPAGAGAERSRLVLSTPPAPTVAA